MVWKYVASLQDHPCESGAASENCFDLWRKVYSKHVNDERGKITALENHYTLFGQITKQTLTLSPENLNKTRKFEGWDLKKVCWYFPFHMKLLEKCIVDPYSLEAENKLNAHKTIRRCSGHLWYVLCTFNLPAVYRV